MLAEIGGRPRRRRAIDVVRRHGNPRPGPRLFVSHGTVPIDGYLPFLAGFLAGFDIVAFDMRSHGHNPVRRAGNHDYAHMARDIDAIGRCRARPNSAVSRGRAVSFDVGAVGAVADSLPARHFDALIRSIRRRAAVAGVPVRQKTSPTAPP